MLKLLKKVEDQYKSAKVTDVKSGDTVRVHQRIKEGSKERIQVFEGLVIRTRRLGSATATIAVRRISSGVGVEKTFQIHSPLIEKLEVVKRSKVRRNNLSYMRRRSGKSARLAGVDFDSDAVNYVPDVEAKEEPIEEVPEAVSEDEKPSAEAENAKTRTEVTAGETKQQEVKAEPKPDQLATNDSAAATND